MTAAFDEEALRNWLTDYLVTNIGCSPDDLPDVVDGVTVTISSPKGTEIDHAPVAV